MCGCNSNSEDSCCCSESMKKIGIVVAVFLAVGCIVAAIKKLIKE